nr:translation initiation factor IF-2-like isoform X2 [Pan paniscus]
MPSSAPRGPTEPALRRPNSAERPLAPGPSPSPSAGRATGAMASPSGSSEATGKPRGRDRRPRREEDDIPPEEKRLRLLLEGRSPQPEDCEDGEDAPRPGREETGTQTGGDGRGVQAEPPEPWPALPADLKPLASPEAGMAGPGGRRTTSLPKRRGCGCCWRGKRTARGLRGRGGRAAAGQGGDRDPDRWRRQRAVVHTSNPSTLAGRGWRIT